MSVLLAGFCFTYAVQVMMDPVVNSPDVKEEEADRNVVEMKQTRVLYTSKDDHLRYHHKHIERATMFEDLYLVVDHNDTCRVVAVEMDVNRANWDRSSRKQNCNQ